MTTCLRGPTEVSRGPAGPLPLQLGWHSSEKPGASPCCRAEGHWVRHHVRGCGYRPAVSSWGFCAAHTTHPKCWKPTPGRRMDMQRSRNGAGQRGRGSTKSFRSATAPPLPARAQERAIHCQPGEQLLGCYFSFPSILIKCPNTFRKGGEQD